MKASKLFAKYLKLEKIAENRQKLSFSSQEIKEAWDKANKAYQQWQKATGKNIEEEY